MQYYTREHYNTEYPVYKITKLNVNYDIEITIKIVLQKRCARAVITTNKYVIKPRFNMKNITVHLPMDISTVKIQPSIHSTSDYIKRLIFTETKNIDRLIGKLQRIYLTNKLKRIKKIWKYRPISNIHPFHFTLYHSNNNPISSTSIGFKRPR